MNIENLIKNIVEKRVEEKLEELIGKYVDGALTGQPATNEKLSEHPSHKPSKTEPIETDLNSRKQRRRLEPTDRQEIEKFIKEGFSNKWIAAKVGFSPSVVSRIRCEGADQARLGLSKELTSEIASQIKLLLHSGCPIPDIALNYKINENTVEMLRDGLVLRHVKKADRLDEDAYWLLRDVCRREGV